MLSRMERIGKKLNKISLDSEFYNNFCEVIIIFNDLKYFYKIDLEDTAIGKLLINISYSLLQRISTDNLLKFYPMQFKEHIHFFLHAEKLGIDLKVLYNYFDSDIIQKNEWEEHSFNYFTNQISFIKGSSSYALDTTQANLLKNRVKTINELLNIRVANLPLEDYLLIVSQQEDKIKNTVFSEIKTLLLEEVKNVP